MKQEPETIFVPPPNDKLTADLFEILDKYKAKEIGQVTAVCEIRNAMVQA